METEASADSEQCKICGSSSAGTQFGIRSCRACSAFFRRALTTKKKFECFIGCPYSQDCKKCRLDRCLAAGMIPTVSLRNKCSENLNFVSFSATLTTHPEILLLHRLMGNYKDLRRERISIEKEILKDEQENNLPSLKLLPSHELEPFYFANFDLVNRIWRGTAQLSIQFLGDSFDEYHSLDDQSKFSLFQNFIFLLYLCEGYYRAVKTFKKRPLEAFYTSSLTALPFSKYEEYFAETQMVNPSSQVKDKFIELEVRCRDLIVPILDQMELTEIEFVALLVVTIASSSSETNCSDLIKIGDEYSIRVYQELHTLYRDEFKLDNYASRFGQLMTLANALQMCASEMITELQFLNFFDVFNRQSFASSITRKTKVKEEPMF